MNNSETQEQNDDTVVKTTYKDGCWKIGDLNICFRFVFKRFVEKEIDK